MRILEWLKQGSKTFHILFSLTLVGFLGAWDYVSDPDFSFLIFYLVPLFFATWFVGRAGGYGILGSSGVIWILDDLHLKRSYSHPAIPFWNLGVKFLFFIFVVEVVVRLHKTLGHEKELARTDPLTEVSNARQFDEMARLEIHRSLRYRHPFTLVYLDIDNFKLVNDQFGHSVGDALLKVLAKTLEGSIRNTDLLARLGGDEFALLLPETGSEGARFALKRLHKHLNDAMTKNGWGVTVSYGAVTFNTAPPSVDAALYRADQLMYRAKQAGKNQIKYETWEESSQRQRL